jgi:hypothetical protein
LPEFFKYLKREVMKRKLFYVLFFLMLAPFLFAQEETLLGSGEISNGGFGGPVVKFTSINKHFGVLLGGQGGWIINHAFVIGGGGYGLVNNVKTDYTILGEQQLLNFGYGGLELHYIGDSDRLIHYTFSLLIGAGGIGYRAPNYLDWDNNSRMQSFFVMEPAARVMLNVTSFFRLGIGAGYRYVSGADLDNLKDNEISGASAEIVLKFGKF